MFLNAQELGGLSIQLPQLLVPPLQQVTPAHRELKALDRRTVVTTAQLEEIVPRGRGPEQRTAYRRLFVVAGDAAGGGGSFHQLLILRGMIADKIKMKFLNIISWLMP